MSIWGMPSVGDQPTVTLIRWRILRLKAKKVSIDLVLGWCLEDGHARMSTPIKQHDSKARTLVTKSGRVYVLEGPHDYDDDAQYILEEHFGPVTHKAIDVSTEYFDDSLDPVQDDVEKMVSSKSEMSLSREESFLFSKEIDMPFQSNEKLTKAIKKITRSNE